MTPSQMWIGGDCGPQTRPLTNILPCFHICGSDQSELQLRNYAKTRGEGNIPPSSHFLTDQQNPHASFTLAKNPLTPNSIWLLWKATIGLHFWVKWFCSSHKCSSALASISSDSNTTLRWTCNHLLTSQCDVCWSSGCWCINTFPSGSVQAVLGHCSVGV